MTGSSIIKFDGKPFEKLIQVISNGIGIVYRPIAIRQEAKAEAYKIEIIERARTKALLEGKEAEVETYHRIQERIFQQETRRQQNIDGIVGNAAKQLEKENNVSGEQVEKDWTVNFFNIAQDVSDDEMQALWGRILAGEIKQPKSFSLRTLELLKTLSKEEAAIFMKVANFAINPFGYIENYLYKGNYRILEKNNISFMNITNLVECGLIQPDTSIVLQFKPEYVGMQFEYVAGKYYIFVDIQKCPRVASISVHLFTKPGAELLKLVEKEPPMGYLSEFAKEFNSELNHIVSKVTYSEIIDRDGDVLNVSEDVLSFI